MKKLIALLLAALYLSGCSPKPAVEDTAALPAPISQTINGLTIQVDPRLELLSILQYMGTENINVRMGLMSRFYSDYKKDVDNHFRQYDKYPAVQYYDSLTVNADQNGMFAIDEPPAMMLFMNDDFTVNHEAYDSYAKSMSSLYFNTPEKLQEFYTQLHSFYVDSEFQKFYDAHKEYYETIVGNTVAILPKENLIGYMEEFFGEKADGYTVNLVTLFHTGGFGGEAKVNSKLHIYSSIGPDASKDHLPNFWDTAYFTELEAHEFGHSFINIANEKNSPIAKEIVQSEYLFEPIREDMRAHAYDSWDTALEETILRACVVRIMEKYDTVQAAALLQSEKDGGYLYIGSVYESLGDYIQNKARYATFSDFLPVIMERLMQEYLPIP